MRIIGISGKASSGKTTLATQLCLSYGWDHYSLAHSLKEKAKRDFSLTEDQVNGKGKQVIDARYQMTPRLMLIKLGKFYRSIDPDFWIKQLSAEMLKRPQAQSQTAVISDVRFENEANWITRHGGLMVRLNRAIELRGFDIDDPSETDLDNYKRFDLMILESSNVDLQDLEVAALRVHDLVTTSKAA